MTHARLIERLRQRALAEAGKHFLVELLNEAADALAQSEKDAARYRWLRERAQKVALFSMEQPSVQIRFPIVVRNERYQSIPKGDDLDIAIDAAILKEPPCK